MTYCELIITLVQFQAWKVVSSFGVVHQQAGNKARLKRLFGFSTSVDLLSGVVGSSAGFVGVLFVGPLLHWTPSEEHAAAVFGAAMLMTSGTTPAGLLRLFNRFDLQAYLEAVGQLARFVGCLVGWAIGAGVVWFLCVWPLAALLEMILQWAAVLALGHRLSFGYRALRLTCHENRGLWSFIVKTSISSSLSLLCMQFGTLVVGMRAGPVEAGGFRLAYRFSQAMMKPVEIATKALFPELARLVAGGDEMTTRKVLISVTRMSTAFGSLVVLATVLGGRELLGLFAGPRFEFASMYLVLLCSAAAMNVAGFALEPFLNAHFRQGAVLRTYVVAALLYGAMLGMLLPVMGAKAVAIASIGAALASVIQLGISTFQILGPTNRQAAGLKTSRA